MGRSSRGLQWLRLLLLVMVLALGAAILAALSGRAGVFRPGTDERALPTSDASSPADLVPPDVAYAALDPAFLPALDTILGYDAPDPLHTIVEGIPPIGVYLPATGDTQFTLPKTEPTPTLAPLPTESPLPEPTEAEELGIVEPPTPTPYTPPLYLGGPPAEDYGGEGCAPAGWPAAGTLTQYFHRWHYAIDLGMPLGTPLVATHSGTVIFAGWRADGYGNLIIIQNGRFTTYYAHLTDFNVVEGQQVGRKSIIGWSGSTGNSTGPHLHYEVRVDDVEVDPLTFEQRGYPTC